MSDSSKPNPEWIRDLVDDYGNCIYPHDAWYRMRGLEISEDAEAKSELNEDTDPESDDE